MTLFITTATDVGVIAVLDGEKITWSRQFLGNNDYLKTAFEQLEQLDLKKINKVVVSIGPGSFTGIRIGLMFAKTMALVNEVELYQINQLELLAITNDVDKVALDARGNKYYVYNCGEIELLAKEELTKEYLIEAEVKLEKLNLAIRQAQPVNYQQIKAFYLKEVL